MKPEKDSRRKLRSRFLIASIILAVLFIACAAMLFAWGCSPNSVGFPAAAAALGVWLAVTGGIVAWQLYFKVIRPLEELENFSSGLAHGEYPLHLRRQDRQNAFPELFRSMNLLRDRLQSQNSRLQNCLQREQEEKRTRELYSELHSRILMTMIPELRSPLNSIAGYLYLLHHYPSSGHCPEWIRSIEYCLLDSERKLKGLTEVSRMGGNSGSRIVRSSFDTAGFMRETSQQAAHMAKELNVALINRYSAHAPGIIHSDRRLLEQLISILLRIALNTSPPGGSVEFSCTGEAGYAMLKIRANRDCRGINHLAEILRACHQNETMEVPPQHEKLVLGLLFVEAQAALLNGALSIRTDEQQRLDLTLKFPSEVPKSNSSSLSFAENPTARGDGPFRLPENRRPGQPGRLLLIDKDRDFLNILQAMLPQTELTAFSDPLKLPPDFDPSTYDLLILNVSPDHSEEQLAAAAGFSCAARPPALPVVIIQDDESPRLLQRFEGAAIAGTFIKPFDFKELRRLLIGLGSKES